MTQKRALILVAVMIIFSGSLALFLYKQGIRYSLYQAYRAYKKHDITTFEKYVDLEGVLNNLFDHITSFDDPKDSAFEDFIEGLTSLVKPKVIPAIKQEIYNIIERGEYEQKTSNYWSDDLVTMLANRYLPTKDKGIKFKGFDHIIREGKIAYAGLKLFNARYDTTLTLVLKLRNKGSYWQIADITNFKEFIKKTDSLEQIRTDRINAQLKSQMNSIVRLTGFTKKSIKQEFWFFTSRQVICKLAIENTGDTEIDFLKATIFCTDKNQDTLASFVISNNKPLSPGQTDTIIAQKEIYFYNDKGKALYLTPASNLQPVLEVNYIQFADSSEIKLVDKWE